MYRLWYKSINRRVENQYLKTAAEGGSLAIIGRGVIGQCQDVLHCPSASANLIPTDLIAICGGTVMIGMYGITVDTLFCEIKMKRRNGHEKVIRAQKHRDLWWIKNSEVFDLLIRGGFTTTEVLLFQMQAAENLFYSAMAVSGSENQKRKNPDSLVEYESDGDHLLGAESVKIRMNAFKEARDIVNVRTRKEPHEERRLYVR